MKSVFVILLILILGGCQKESPTQTEQRSAQLGDSFELKPGEAIMITGTPVSFRFDSVLFDGRCPEGVLCFWEGNAAIIISFPTEQDTVMTMDPHKIYKNDYEVTLQKLSPYPKSNQKIPKDAYVAQLSVLKHS